MKAICLICKKECNIRPSRKGSFKTCSQECRKIYMTGHKPFHWKGGRLVHKGYIYILEKKHPNTDRDGYVLEHRVVMEKHIKRFLRRGEIVHHKNRIRSDNRIQNLELKENQSKHMLEHSKKGNKGFISHKH